MNHLASHIHAYHSLELASHISPDDVLVKVTEEAHELGQAISEENPGEIQKEASDVLVNVLSLASRYMDLDELIIPNPKNSNISDLIALWVRQTMSIRGRYSREEISPDAYTQTTSELISHLLLLSGSEVITSVIAENISKFQNRVADYLPDINLKDYIGAYPDFPKPGILFRDIAALLANPEALRYASYELARHARHADVIAWLDARGFIFGTRVAEILGKPFIMIRKKSKLPGPTVGTDYSLEYGDNCIEIQSDAVKPGQRVAIVDDLLATGGTLEAAAGLIEKVWGKVEALLCLIALDEPFLLAQTFRKNIGKYKTESILHYE